MKKRLHLKGFFALALALALTVGALPPAWGASGGIEGKVTYNSSAAMMGFSEAEVGQTISFHYSDSWFAAPSTRFNHDLANMSLRLAISAWTAAEAYNADNKNSPVLDKTGYTRAARNVRDLYKAIGFTPLRYFHYDAPMDDEEDKAAFSFAEKRLELNGRDTVLLALVIRGGNYGGEWVSNGNVGDGMNHAGFEAAATEAVKEAEKLLAAYPKNLAVKLWITGYSRSAGITNLAAAALDRSIAQGKSPLQKDNLFVYAFAVPANTKDPEAGGAMYSNIFNIINPVDVILLVPFDAWGFRRYGVTKYLGFLEKGAEYDRLDAVYAGLFDGLVPKGMTFDSHLVTWENFITLYVINEIIPAFMTTSEPLRGIQPYFQNLLRGIFVQDTLMPDIATGNYRHAYDDIFGENAIWGPVHLAAAALTLPLNGPAALLGREPVIDPGVVTLAACIVQQLAAQVLRTPPTPLNLLRSVPITLNALGRAVWAGIGSDFSPASIVNNFMIAHSAESYLAMMSLPADAAYGSGEIRGLRIG
ncbi:MAG: hypothetical protein FWC27_03635 [Firmicutes bacterium]|nr:hypothetical protein [Bacillota bacterium]